jgi:hypothetical protein
LYSIETKRRRVFVVCSVSFALIVSAFSFASAQAVATSAALAGRVIDSTGAAVPGATVVVTHQARSQRWEAISDERGAYRFPFLAVGTYRIDVQLAGFTPVSREIELAVGAAIDLPIVLTVAGVTESVAVTGAPAGVDIARQEVAERVSPTEISTLPLNGRNYLDLALLAPGVNRTNIRNTERFAETSAVPGTGLSVLGQRNIGNTFVVDGVSGNDDAADLAGTYLSQEVIREFQVITNGAAAEFGRSSSGAFNIVTQSGANSTNGNAYGFFRDDKLDARNPFATSRDPLSQQQFGATLGGPIARDRTFYFVNAEQTLNERTAYISITESNVAAVNQVLESVGYRGPRIGTGAFGTGYDTTNLFGRVDAQLSAGHLLTGRYSFYDISSENARSVGALNDISRGTSLNNRDQSVAFSSVVTMPSGVVNEIRGQFWRSQLDAPGNDLVGPAVGISGVANFGASTTSPVVRDLDVYQINDTVTFQRGAHLVKGGVDLLYNDLLIGFPGALPGTYTFSSLANFRQGIYTQFQQAFGEENQEQRNPNLAIFVQDEWRAAHSLTVSVGLRYDLQGIEDPVQTDWNNVSPRLGLAWAPGDRRTVVRGAFGLFYDRIPLRAVSNALQRDGSKYRVAVLSFGQAGAPTFPNVLPAFPSGLVTAITTIDPDIEAAQSWQGSAQVERDLGHNVYVTAAYQGLRGSKIIMSRNVNVPTLTATQAAALGVPNLGRPNPNFANISRFGSLGRSRYDGLTVSGRAPVTGWGHARVSYTFGKSLDDAGNAFFSTPQDNFDIGADWGPSDNDQRHRLVLSGALEAPSGSRLVILRRFQLAWVLTYGSPQPFNVVTGGDRNNDTNVNDRPVGVARNTGEGFDYQSLDLRLGYRFRMGGVSAEASIDAFNVLNRPNLLFPNNTFGPGTTPLPTFGLATVAADPRQLQLGVRVRF